MKKAIKLSDIATRFARRQEIRIDDRHTIKLRTSRWFPEMLVLTGILAATGTWMYGHQIGSETSFTTFTTYQTAEPAPAASRPKPTAKSAQRFAAAPKPQASTNPRIVATQTNTKAITLDVTAAKIVGDEAVITYRIFNHGTTMAAGSTWLEGASARPTERISWKAKNFTVKTVNFPLAGMEKDGVRIVVADGQANTANTYKVQF
jgi:hypothetical protein